MREAWLFRNGCWKSLGQGPGNYHLLAHLNATLLGARLGIGIKKTRPGRPAHVHCDLLQISDGPLPHIGSQLQ